MPCSVAGPFPTFAPLPATLTAYRSDGSAHREGDPDFHMTFVIGQVLTTFDVLR